MARKNLKNKPLAEAIFELRWELPPQQVPSLSSDPHYRLLLGRFSERVQKEYPVHEQLAAAQIPDAMVAHTPQHRFRTSKDSWPLIQIGHGVMTLNDTKAYTWKDFQKRSRKAVTELHDSHPAKGEFKVKDLSLRYIDAIDVDFSEEDVFSFLRGKMKTNIALPDGLFASGQVNSTPDHFQWETAFPTKQPGGTITLKFGTGRRNDNPAVILETRVHTPADQLPDMPSGFSDWLDKAHHLTDDWFFQLIEGELEERFS